MENKDKNRYNDSMALDPKLINSNADNNTGVHPIGIEDSNALTKVNQKKKKKK